MSHVDKFVCDGCKQEVEFEGAHGWLALSTMSYPQADVPLEPDSMPHGTFCSVDCLCDYLADKDDPRPADGMAVPMVMGVPVEVRDGARGEVVRVGPYL